MIFYESPFRVVKTLEQFAVCFGAERRVAVVREITKKFEQSVRGTITEVISHFKAHPPKGEFVIVVAGKNLKDRKTDNDEDNTEEYEQE